MGRPDNRKACDETPRAFNYVPGRFVTGFLFLLLTKGAGHGTAEEVRTKGENVTSNTSVMGDGSTIKTDAHGHAGYRTVSAWSDKGRALYGAVW